YLDYLESEFAWQPLEFDLAGTTVEPITVKVERANDWGGDRSVRDESRLRLRVPIGPHPQRADYLKFGPSTTWSGQSESEWRFEGDTLVYDVEASEAAVQRGLDAIRFWFGNRNDDIEK